MKFRIAFLAVMTTLPAIAMAEVAECNLKIYSKPAYFDTQKLTFKTEKGSSRLKKIKGYNYKVTVKEDGFFYNIVETYRTPGFFDSTIEHKNIVRINMVSGLISTESSIGGKDLELQPGIGYDRCSFKD